MQIFQNKKVLIGLVVVVVLLVGGGAYYLLGTNKSQTPVYPGGQQIVNAPTLSPDAIGLSINIRSDKKAMKFTIANAKDITNVEYSISYMANQKGQNVQQGLIGELAPNPGDASMSTQYREFGTCSSGTCRYDNVVSPITLTLKVTKTDGQAYQVTKVVSL